MTTTYNFFLIFLSSPTKWLIRVLKIHLFWNAFQRLNWCWRRMLEAICVDDKFEILLRCPYGTLNQKMTYKLFVTKAHEWTSKTMKMKKVNQWNWSNLFWQRLVSNELLRVYKFLEAYSNHYQMRMKKTTKMIWFSFSRRFFQVWDNHCVDRDKCSFHWLWYQPILPQ